MLEGGDLLDLPDDTDAEANITSPPFSSHTPKAAPKLLSVCQLVSHQLRLAHHAKRKAPKTAEATGSPTSVVIPPPSSSSPASFMRRLALAYPGGVKFPRAVRILEVSPRDGLQNERRVVETAAKVDFVNALAAAGMGSIELTSFVSPKWVPQLADAARVSVAPEVERHCTGKQPTRFSALVPNMRGLSNLLATGAAGRTVGEIAIFASATESFSQRNLNCGIEQSLQRFRPVVSAALEYNLRVRAYISCIIACPYEGPVDAMAVAHLAHELHAMGVHEIALADTIGAGDPQSIATVVNAVVDHGRVPVESLAIHCHDTKGNALANVLAAMSCGITTIDASVAGLGGCPFAPDAPGNLATEDLVVMLRAMDIDVGPIDLDALIQAGRKMCKYLGREPTSRVYKSTSSLKDSHLSENLLTDNNIIAKNVLQQISL